MFDGSFTVPVFLDFLQRLVNQNKCKVFLVVDNLSVHKSQAVSEWVKMHCTRIRIFFLPKYSPYLNPDE